MKKDEIDDLLEERQKTHGKFEDVARVTFQLMHILKYEPRIGCHNTRSVVQREALHMICSKLARIACGNPDIKDHWDDIAGYAKLASQEIKKRKSLYE